MVQGLFSVIVPVYSVEKYLRKCIDSILAQIYPSYEIILVDDGSKDASGRICDEYAANYQCCKVIHQENKGLSAARNTGLKNAQGEYICFVDSDDYIEKELLSKTAYYLEQGYEIVSFMATRVDEEGHYLYDIRSRKELVRSFDLTQEKYLFLYNYILQYKLGWEAWIQVFRADLLNCNHIFFDESIRFAEDRVFTVECCTVAHKYKKLPDRLYNYVERGQSITGQDNDSRMIAYAHESCEQLRNRVNDSNDVEKVMLYVAVVYYYCQIYMKNHSLQELIDEFKKISANNNFLPILEQIGSKRDYILEVFGTEEGKRIEGFFAKIRKGMTI